MSARSSPIPAHRAPARLETDQKTYHTVKGSLGRSHFAIDPHAVEPPSPPGQDVLRKRRPTVSDPLRCKDRPKDLASSSAMAGPPDGLPPAPAAMEGGLFHSVPRNAAFEALLPILSRLPSGSQISEEIEPEFGARLNDDEHGRGAETLDYIQGQHGPYTRSRLPEIDLASLALWRSLHSFRPLTTDYATGFLTDQRGPTLAPHPIPTHGETSHSVCPAFSRPHSRAASAALSTIRRVFNWHELPPLPLELAAEWYGVVFRSARAPGSESVDFYEADRLAHEEAVGSGGLLMYWYGSPDPRTGENLATCIWTSRDQAIKASRLRKHSEAARFARRVYTTYDLTRYTVRKLSGQTGLSIEEWEEDKW